MKTPLIAAGLIIAQALAQPASAPASETPMADSSAVEAEVPETFPFAHNEVPENFPSVGFTLGVGGYLSGFTSAERVFHAMEDTFGAQGFPVPRAREVQPGPMVVPTLMVRFGPRLDVRFQMARAGGATTDKVTLMGGLLSGRVPLSPGGKVSLFGGLGGGTYRFSFKRDYAARVTANDGNGGYYMLESIRLEGGGGYWTTVGGLTIRALPGGAFEAQIQYVGTDDVSTNTTSVGEVRVGMSGAMITLSIVGFL